jgi:N-acetylglucosaminyl-diphospho-decaprenol L-rhamnosyltransferase
VPPPTPSIDVVIVTTKARELVVSCLEHLGRQTVPHTIYLADNANNEDGTTDVVHERFPHVHLTTNAENMGFGKAVDMLAAQGSGDVVVLANDDMDVEPQFLEKLVEPLVSDPRVGMVAGLTLQPGDGQVVDAFGIEADPTLVAFNRLRHRRPSDVPGTLLGPSGGAAAYRRSAWEAAGGFEPAFFVYAEDLDLALRLRLAGWNAAAAPEARGVHLGGATTGLDSPFQRRHGGFGRGFVLRRYGILRSRHAPRALLFEAIVVLWGMLRFRTALPLRARIEGWRAAGRGPRLRVPEGAVDSRITLRETIRRARFER